MKIQKIKFYLVFTCAFLVFLMIPIFFIAIQPKLGNIVVNHLKIRINPEFSGGEVMTILQDPYGDDKGPGTYTYPDHELYSPGYGHLDLIKYIVRKPVKNFKTFGDNHFWAVELMFQKLENPFHLPGQFSFPVIHIYIHLPNKPGGSLKTLNDSAQVRFDPQYPWHYFISVNGSSDHGSLFNESGEQIGQIQVFLIRNEDKIRLIIPASQDKDLMALTGNDPTFHYVMIANYDPNGKDYIKPIQHTASRYFGGGCNDCEASPMIYDYLAPEQDAQYQMLNSYNSKNKTFAMLKPVEIKSRTFTAPEPKPFINQLQIDEQIEKTQSTYKKTIISLEKMLKEMPNELSTLIELTSLYFKTGNFIRSEEFAKEILRLNEKNPVALAYVAAIHAQKASLVNNIFSASIITKQSLWMLDQALSLVKENTIDWVHVLSCRAGVFTSIPENFNRLDTAIKDLNKLIIFMKYNGLISNLFDQQILLGQVYDQKKMYKKAIDQYKEAEKTAQNQYQINKAKERIQFSEYWYTQKLLKNL